VSDRVGSNEKTKVVVRLQPKAGGPPVREPAVSEDERKAMMAWYVRDLVMQAGS
jgi:cilia- and flagella-associated protein 298